MSTSAQIELLANTAEVLSELSTAMVSMGLKKFTKRQVKELKMKAGQVYTYLSLLETITEA
jgi:hypothetical protein